MSDSQLTVRRHDDQGPVASKEVWKRPVNHGRLNRTRLVAVVTPTDRPESVRSRCGIEVLVALLCCYVSFGIFMLMKGLLSCNWVRSHPFSHHIVFSAL